MELFGSIIKDFNCLRRSPKHAPLRWHFVELFGFNNIKDFSCLRLFPEHAPLTGGSRVLGLLLESGVLLREHLSAI